MDSQKAETIAQWWVDRMDDQEKHDNGEPDFGTNLVKGIEELKSQGFKFKDTTVTSEQKYAFKRYLKVRLMAAEEGEIEHLHVDYNPDDIIEDALMAACINFNPFPIKTVLWVDSMRCRIGYGGEIVDVEVAE